MDSVSLAILGVGGDPATVWAAVLALATLGGTVAILGGLLFAYRELQSFRNDQELRAAIEIHGEYAGLREARDFVIEELDGVLAKLPRPKHP